ncbi:Lysophosphatidylcholine acyltransferase 1 [Halotydeus destructor]|nr:Lysophosphatidylcholine acyltransferase 1 [Halotydeus destructor]
MFFVGGFYWINVIDKSGQDQDEKNRKAPIIVAAPHSGAKQGPQLWPMSRACPMTDILPYILFDAPSVVAKKQALDFPLFGSMDPITWTWDGPNGFYLIYLLLCKWKHSLDIVKLPVYCPTKDEVSNAKLFADNVRHVISKELDVPLSFYSYDDVMLMDYCKQHSIPRSPACIKLIKVVHKITLQRNDAIDEHFRLQSNMSDVHSELVSSRILSLKSQADTQITDRASLLTLLEQFENSYVGQSTSVDELLEVLHHTSKGPIYANNLLSLLQLCNIA